MCDPEVTIPGAKVRKTESTFTIDPEDKDIREWPETQVAKDWLKARIAEVIDSDVEGSSPLIGDGISVTLRMYSARGRKPC